MSISKIHKKLRCVEGSVVAVMVMLMMMINLIIAIILMIFISCITVPYSGDALRKMIDKQHEEIKQKLHKFAEIMKKEHVRISLN